MKNKSLLFVLVFAIATTLPAIESHAMQSAADTAIVINPFPGFEPGTGGPKAPVPVSASYEPFLSSVVLSFSQNLGVIEVEVFNTSNGYYDSDFVNTLFLSAVIPICGGPGHYIITFTLPSGQQYGGEFDV